VHAIYPDAPRRGSLGETAFRRAPLWKIFPHGIGDEEAGRPSYALSALDIAVGTRGKGRRACRSTEGRR